MYQSYKSSIEGLKEILKEFEPNIKIGYGKSLEDFKESVLFNDRALLISWNAQTLDDLENSQYNATDTFNLYLITPSDYYDDKKKDILEQIEDLKAVLNTRMRINEFVRSIDINSISAISDDMYIIVEISLII